MSRTVILMYHRVSRTVPADPEERTYTLTPSVFERQMEHIAAGGAKPLGLDDVLAGRFPDRSVLITFDDGFDTDLKTAFPLLRDLGLRAAFFVSPALLGREGYLSWRGVERLVREGMDVGAHGLDHRLLDRLPPGELERQLSLSRKRLERRLGIEVHALSLPGGRGGRRVARAARREGYRLVLGSRPAPFTTGGAVWVLPRFAIRQGITWRRYRGLIAQEPAALWREGLRYWTGETARMLLGRRWYRRLSAEVASRRWPAKTPRGERFVA